MTKTSRLLLLWAIVLGGVLPVWAQGPLISSPASGTLGIDSDAPLTLAWTTVPDATAYLVELSESATFDLLLPLMDAQVAAQPGRLGQNYAVQFADDTALRPGRTYYWRVTAIRAGGQLRSEVATFRTISDPFGALAERHFYLTRAEDGVDKDKPASIGFIRQGGDTPSQEVFAEFLFGWEGPSRFIPPQGSFAMSPSLLFAGKMSSADEQDTMAKLAGGLVADWSFGDAPVRSLYQTLNIALEGDQAFDDSNLQLDYLLTYSGPYVGRFHPASPAAPAQVFVRPYLLATLAGDVQSSESEEGKRQTRVGTQVDVKVRLNGLARALGISGTLLSITDRWYALSGHTRDRANYLTASLDFQIARGFAFGYAFKRGRDAPGFKGVNRMALTLGIGFGR